MRPIAMSCASGAASWVAGLRARISARLAAFTTSTIAEMNPAMTKTRLSDRARVTDLDMRQLSACDLTIQRFESARIWPRDDTKSTDVCGDGSSPHVVNWQGDWLRKVRWSLGLPRAQCRTSRPRQHPRP